MAADLVHRRILAFCRKMATRQLKGPTVITARAERLASAVERRGTDGSKGVIEHDLCQDEMMPWQS